MSRRSGLVCAGCLWLIAGGCAFQVGNTGVEVGVKVNEQVVNDTIDGVALRIQTELQRQGLQVVSSPEQDAIRLTSTTKDGQKFVVVLSRVKGPRGDQTRVHIDWDVASDKELLLQLLLVAGQTAIAAR